MLNLGIPKSPTSRRSPDKGYSDGDTEWELAHLLGYAGQSDAERASNAGQMMVEAMAERKIEQPFVVALGYPRTYAGFHVSGRSVAKFSPYPPARMLCLRVFGSCTTASIPLALA